MDKNLKKFICEYMEMDTKRSGRKKISEIPSDVRKEQKVNNKMAADSVGEKQIRIPLIQGGMGVGISLGRLAGAVAKEGAAGIISNAQIGFREPDLRKILPCQLAGNGERI
mgnify:CR=1 FL=1